MNTNQVIGSIGLKSQYICMRPWEDNRSSWPVTRSDLHNSISICVFFFLREHISGRKTNSVFEEEKAGSSEKSALRS